jgi:hypothetical protein
MTKLEHGPHELFCNIVARGNLPLVAYVGAGYRRDKKAAEALLKVPNIAARIEELTPIYFEIYRSRVSPLTMYKRKKARNA